MTTAATTPTPGRKPERPAAATWTREGGEWLLKVRASMHRPGRVAKVTARGQVKLLVLGRVERRLPDGTFVLSAFEDRTPRPPRVAGKTASNAQMKLLLRLWDERGGGTWVTAGPHTLERPPAGWDGLTSGDISWYIDALKQGRAWKCVTAKRIEKSRGADDAVPF
jgi:hypothetical protein